MSADIFRTPWKPTPAEMPRFISHSDRIVTIGSCFADNVGERLKADMVRVTANPLGTMYNPASIAGCVDRLVNRQYFTASDLFEHNGMLHTFSTHSSLSSYGDEEAALEKLNAAVDNGADAIASADVVILTLGTAWTFHLAGSDRVVANCHKLPASRFERIMMSVDEAGQWLRESCAKLRSIRHDQRIIITVSPIRHLSDGLHGNMLSKSTLILAAERIITEESDIYYFPAFELMLDDLRDYRFYAADMVHPSSTAIDYIYSRFTEAYFTPEAIATAAECGKLSRRLSHRLNPDASPEMNARFKAETETLHNQLITKYPYLQ